MPEIHLGMTVNDVLRQWPASAGSDPQQLLRELTEIVAGQANSD